MQTRQAEIRYPRQLKAVTTADGAVQSNKYALGTCQNKNLLTVIFEKCSFENNSTQ